MENQNLQGIIKKVYSWKILAKLTTPISLTHSCTYSIKINSNYIVLWVGNVLLKDTLKTAWARYARGLIITGANIHIIVLYSFWSMLYKLSSFEKFGACLDKCKS